MVVAYENVGIQKVHIILAGFFAAKIAFAHVFLAIVPDSPFFGDELFSLGAPVEVCVVARFFLVIPAVACGQN